MKQRLPELILPLSIAFLNPSLFNDDFIADKKFQKLKVHSDKTCFMVWKTLLALHYFYEHCSAFYKIFSLNDGSHILTLDRTNVDTTSGLPYCLSFFEVFHNIISLRMKTRPISIPIEVSRGRLMKGYLKDLQCIGMKILPRSLSLSFTHAELLNKSSIEGIPGFLEFKEFMDHHLMFYPMSVTLSCRKVLLRLQYSTSASHSPLTATTSLSPQPTPCQVLEEVQDSRSQEVIHFLKERNALCVSVFNPSFLPKIVAEIIGAIDTIDAQHREEDPDFQDFVSRLCSSPSASVSLSAM